MSLELVINGVVIVIEGNARVVVTTPKKKKKVPAEEAEPPQIAEEAEATPKSKREAVTSRNPLPSVGDPVVGSRMPYLSQARKLLLGNRVKEARVALAMSQAQLNRECQFPQSMISLIETGRRYPNSQRRRTLEHALGLPPGDLG